MKRICWCVLLALLMGLVPAAVSADVELRGDIGAATIRVEGEVTGVDYDGYAVFANHDGYALVSVFDAYEHDSLTIIGNTGDYTVEVAVNGNAENITLTEAVPDISVLLSSGNYSDGDGGQSIASMNADAWEPDWSGEDYWLWT